MKKQVLIIGEDSLLKLKLISIISRSQEVLNVHTLEEASNYFIDRQIGYIVFTSQLVTDSRLTVLRQSGRKIICLAGSSVCVTRMEKEDGSALQIFYDQLYGFSGYSDSASIVIQSSFIDKSIIYPTFVDDVAFWLSHNLDTCGNYYLRGPELVLRREFLNSVSQLNSIYKPISIQNNDDIFLRELHAYTVHLRHTLKEGLEIIKHQCTCAVNLIYKLPLHAPIAGTTVADIRKKLGALMANCMPETDWKHFDYIAPIPNSGISYAEGLSQAVGVRYVTCLEKHRDVRSFHIENRGERRDIIRRIMKIHEKQVKGARICLVDEAIFTGVTLKILCEMLRDCGVREICVVIPTPPCTTQCQYCSIPTRPMMLETISGKQLASELGADSVFFQKRGVFESILQKTGMTCSECFL